MCEGCPRTAAAEFVCAQPPPDLFKSSTSSAVLLLPSAKEATNHLYFEEVFVVFIAVPVPCDVIRDQRIEPLSTDLLGMGCLPSAQVLQQQFGCAFIMPRSESAR
jgi:hypothetical protein